MRTACLIFVAGGGMWAAGFNRDVRPILSDKCFSCHGPDATAKGIPMRLDVEASAKARVIVPGNPDASELIRRITADQPARRMPPVHTGLKLTSAEIATLREWIAQGAVWERHWAFLAPQPRPVPAGIHPVDYFVRERLKREGLKPSPQAPRETLIRRVTLDLTGLGPTPAEVDAFVKDTSPDAYEKLVGRLLDSPRYGERMAIRWLDAARYADTNGYQYDGERVMWRWRDWVIDSFNRNQRYDRFVLEQTAGDMLPNPALDQRIATGFNRNHRANTEDGIIPDEYAVEYVVDRLETMSTVFLGLTLGCTRCHDHKYDPFTQKEFYQLFAYFNNVPERGRAMKYGNSPPVVAAPTGEQQAALAGLERRIHAERDYLAAHPIPRQWKPSGPVHWAPTSGLDSWFPFEWAEPSVPGPFGRAGVFDGKTASTFSGVAQFDIDDRFTLSAWIFSDNTPDGAVMSRMTDSPRGKGFGVYLNQGRVHVHLTSNSVDDAIRLDTEQTLAPSQWHHILVTYDGSVQAAGVKVYINGQAAPVKVEMETLYRPFRNAGGKYAEPFRIGGGGGPGRRFRGLIDEVRVYSRVLSADEIAALGTMDPARVLRGYYLENEAPGEVRASWRRLLALEREKEQLERSFPTVMVMAESSVPKTTRLLIRGAYDNKGEVMQPGVPAELHPLPAGAPNNRLGFAYWLIDGKNPLTARVAVNRFWQMLFGVGLVKTTEDFGVQGEWPSHPELLDWLATEFVRSGWNVKAMMKLIVTSAAYKQSSRSTPELIQRDPDNRLLAHGPRSRLPAEMIRDQALWAAGLLHEKLGGPSVKPYQPEGLWGEIAMQDMYYVQSKGPGLYRRSIYTFWKRTIAPPMMANFDAANREACVVRETRTNTPLQALNLMNDVTFLEAARFIGQRMILEGGADRDSRLAYGFRLLAGRKAADREIAALRSSLAWHSDYFASDARKAETYLKQGDSPALASIDPRELAAYASVASLMLNLDETLTKQ